MKLIPGHCIPLTSDAAKLLQEARKLIDAAQTLLRRGSLHDEANRALTLSAGASSLASEIDWLGRNSFNAARRGEELPK